MKWTILHNYPDPQVEKHWREFLLRADYPAHYVSPEYFRDPFVKENKPFAILAWHDRKIVGAVTGVHDGREVSCGLMSRPQACFDKQIDLSISAESVIGGLLEEARSAQLISLYTWSRIDLLEDHGYQCKEEEGVVMLDLTEGPEALFKGFSGTRRTDIRNAIKRGVEVSVASTREEFRAYYEIYVDWCKPKELEPVSFESLEEALNLTDSRQLFLARYDGKIIAGTIIRLCPGEMIEYAANSSLSESLKLRPNDVLQWRVVEWACQQGYKRYSLGGAHLFSRRMGGKIVPVYRYRFDRTWLRRHDLKDALGQSGRKVFQALPVGVRKQIRSALKRDE